MTTCSAAAEGGSTRNPAHFEAAGAASAAALSDFWKFNKKNGSGSSFLFTFPEISCMINL
jgi:hypothetical protein